MKLPRFLAAALAVRTEARKRFAVDPLRLFDRERTRDLAALLELPRGRRDAAWTERFFDAAWDAELVVADPAVITGKDGCPYVRVNLPPPGRHKPAAIANLAALCLDRATGIALFAEPSDPVDWPQYLFSVGMLDSMLRFDTWLGDPMDHADAAIGEGTFDPRWPALPAGPARRGAPSVQYLPIHSGRALLNHMRGVWQVADPRVQVVVDATQRPTRHLVVGRKRSEFPADAPWETQRERLAWLLPPGRGLLPMPEDWRLEDLTPLEQLAGQAPAPTS